MKGRILSMAILLLHLALFAFFLGPAAAQLSPTESAYLEIPSGARAYEHLAFFTARPHVAGTLEDYDTALYTQAAFERNGISAKIVPHEVLLSYPVRRGLQIVAPESQRFVAELKEDSIPEDPTSYDPRHIMTYIAYSGTGNVTAELVYVNYGRLEDFLVLEEMGIDVRGKICIARYGSVFRGNKAFFAEERGAAGLIIYSDPSDDGYVRGDVYPEGPWRPSTAVQRGSCLYLTMCPGDPGKPERCGGVDRIRPSLPIIPISYSEAQPLLAGIVGNPAPSNWMGGLPVNYHIGPGPVTVQMDVLMKEEVTTVWNVIAEIKGSLEPDRRVIIGNHRDAWNPGALDPNSGTSVMLEVARGFGELLKQGWTPRRTIQFGSWDAEEFGLIGSVEWGESNAEELKAEVIAYLNVDTAASGSSLGVGASPSIANLVRNCTSHIVDPKTGKFLSEVWHGNVNPLGSGSDFAVFIEYLGIASVDMSFGGSNGVYHSIYDSLTYVQTQSDPGFFYHQAMAQLWGLVTLRLADRAVLEFDYQELADALEGYTTHIEELAAEAGGSVDVSPIEKAISQLAAAGAQIEAERQACLIRGCGFIPLRSLNDRLAFAERRLTNSLGLPKRPWYKNVIYAPGYETGYAADTFPGVVDAIRDLDWELADSQIKVIADCISEAAVFLTED